MTRDDAEKPEPRVVDEEETAAAEHTPEPALVNGEGEAPDEAAAAPEEGPPAEAEARPEARRYRPVDDYAEGDRILHPVWNVEGTVRIRDPRERVFRVSLGRAEERGRCHKIVVEFDEEVPTAQGPRREVALIANWRGRPFEVGEPEPAPVPVEPGPDLLFAPLPEPERRTPDLRDILGSRKDEAEEEEEEEQEEPDEERTPALLDDQESEEDVIEDDDAEDEENGEEEDPGATDVL